MTPEELRFTADVTEQYADELAACKGRGKRARWVRLRARFYRRLLRERKTPSEIASLIGERQDRNGRRARAFARHLPPSLEPKGFGGVEAGIVLAALPATSLTYAGDGMWELNTLALEPAHITLDGEVMARELRSYVEEEDDGE